MHSSLKNGLNGPIVRIAQTFDPKKINSMFKLKPAYITKRLREAIVDTANENFVISFPRSGRNWSRNMLTDCGVPHFKEKVYDFDTFFAEISSTPKIIFTHDVADYPYIKQLTPENPALHFRPGRYKNKKVFLVVRNPIDVTTSFYHWLRYNESIGENVGDYPKDINEFVLSPEFGAAKIAAFHNLWRDFLENGNVVKDYTIYAYEDMKADAGAYLQAMFDLFGFDVPPETIKKAVEKNSIAAAQKDKARETRAGVKLSIHGPEKVSEDTMEKLLEIIKQPPQGRASAA